MMSIELTAARSAATKPASAGVTPSSLLLILSLLLLLILAGGSEVAAAAAEASDAAAPLPPSTSSSRPSSPPRSWTPLGVGAPGDATALSPDGKILAELTVLPAADDGAVTSFNSSSSNGTSHNGGGGGVVLLYDLLPPPGAGRGEPVGSLPLLASVDASTGEQPPPATCLAMGGGATSRLLVGVCDGGYARIFSVGSVVANSGSGNINAAFHDGLAQPPTVGQPLSLEDCPEQCDEGVQGDDGGGDGASRRIHLELSNDLAVVSCHCGGGRAAATSDRPYRRRGWVRLYQLRRISSGGGGTRWALVTEIEGSSPGDGFGYRASLDPTLIPYAGGGGGRSGGTTRVDRLARLAVSSPFYNNSAGRVQVYDVFDDGTAKQVGSDLGGDGSGRERLGFSLALSRTSNSVLAIGSPGAGAVRVYAYQRTLFHSGARWQLLQEIPSNGTTTTNSNTRNNEVHGSTVTLTPDASRLAFVEAVDNLGDSRTANGSSLVHIFDDVLGNFKYQHHSSISGVESHFGQEFGSDIALSDSGAVLAAMGSPKTVSNDEEPKETGVVRAFLDESAFCSVPQEEDKGIQDLFAQRKLCRRAGRFSVQDEAECSGLFAPYNGQQLPCFWAGHVPSVTLAPTAVPSLPPTLAPTSTPSATPAPTAAPSPSPTFGQTITPSTTPDPTAVPSLAQTSLPSAIETLYQPATPVPSSPTLRPTRTSTWNLTACRCDIETSGCIGGRLTEGSPLSICVFLTEEGEKEGLPDIELIVSVARFQLQQGSSRSVVIDGDEARPPDVTGEGASSACQKSSNSITCRLYTPVKREFFSSERPDSLLATGTVAFAFQDHRNIKYLRGHRLMLDEGPLPDDAEFSVEVLLESSGQGPYGEEEDHEKLVVVSNKIWITMLFLVFFISACCWCITQRKKPRNDTTSTANTKRAWQM